MGLLLEGPPEQKLQNVPRQVEAALERTSRLPVHVVVLNGAPVDLTHRILRDGIILLDRDPAARTRFEVRARNAWFDLQPILHRYREARH